MATILSDAGRDSETGSDTEINAGNVVVRPRRLPDRFSPEDLQSMIELYRSGATAKAGAEKFGVSLRSLKRLLHQHGVRLSGGVGSGLSVAEGNRLPVYARLSTTCSVHFGHSLLRGK